MPDFNLVEIWEHEWDKMQELEIDKIDNDIIPREALYH